MFTLITEKSRYFKIKRGQNASQIESVLNVPVCGKAFAGRVITVPDKCLIKIEASVGDSYKTIAVKYGADESYLREINGFKPVYPTCKIFVPKS